MKASNLACCCRMLAPAPCRFFLQSEVHALVTTVLLGVTGLDAFNGDTEPQPPYRKLRELKQSVRRSEGNPVVGSDGPGQTPFFEKALESPECEVFPVGFQRFTQQQKARSVIGDGQRIAITLV